MHPFPSREGCKTYKSILMTGIYKITSQDSRVYIGKTRDWDSRLKHYKSLQCSRQVELYSSLCKYGWFNHTFELIYELPDNVNDLVLNIYEVLFIKQNKSNINRWPDKNGLNMTDGGDSISINTHTLESNKSRSLSLKGIPKTKEHARKIGEAHKGRKCTQEHKDRLRSYGYKNHKSILQYDLEGNFIKEWESVKLAGISLNIAPTNISQCLVGKVKRTRQFTWKYKLDSI